MENTSEIDMLSNLIFGSILNLGKGSISVKVETECELSICLTETLRNGSRIDSECLSDLVFGVICTLEAPFNIWFCDDHVINGGR